MEKGRRINTEKSTRKEKRGKNKKAKKVINIVIGIVAFIIICLIANNYIVFDKNKTINLVINNKNVTSNLKNQVLIENNTIYLSQSDIENFFDKHIYKEDETNEIITTYGKKIAAIGFEKNSININGSDKEIYAHAIEKDGQVYLPISEMKDVYDVEIRNIEKTKVVTMDSLDREQKKAIVTSNLSVKSSTNFLTRTVDRIKKGDSVIIISSDKPPKDMEILEERFRSRFEWGLIADITLPDYETRMAILHKNEEMNGYSISEDVIKYIATNIKSNIRELEGAFNKVMAGAKLEKKEVTLELAEQALKDIISPDEKKVITPEYIISVVAEHYGVTPADLSGNKRNSKIVMPRQVSMYLCREIISTPLKNIGKALGNRDHTTVMHGIEKIENELQNDDNLKNTIDILKKKINPQG